MVRAVLRNSPLSETPSTSRAIVCDRSPCATAPMTRAVSLVGWTRSSISELTERADSSQKPLISDSGMRSESFPSLPATRRRRASSPAIRSLSSTTSLKASATLPSTPVHSIGSRTPDLPRLSDVSAESSVTMAAWDGSGAATTAVVFCSLPSLTWASWSRGMGTPLWRFAEINLAVSGNPSRTRNRPRTGGPQTGGKQIGQRSDSRWNVPQENWLRAHFRGGCAELPGSARRWKCLVRCVYSQTTARNLATWELTDDATSGRAQRGGGTVSFGIELKFARGGRLA